MKIPRKIRFPAFWAVFFCSRLFYLFFALEVYGRLTRLGDTASYLNKPLGLYGNFILRSTDFMRTAGSILGTLFFKSYLSHLPFVLLAFYGLYYAISRLDLKRNEQILILLLLSFPSFGSWTNILGKEAMGVFATGVLCGFTIDLINRKRSKPGVMALIGIYVLLVFKAHYFIAFLHIWFLVWVRNLFKTSSAVVFAIGLLLVVDFSAFYAAKDIINELSFEIVPHFRGTAGSTRPNTIWVEQYDVFYNAPYGMGLAFLGPTLPEAIEKPVQFIPFIESATYIIILGILLFTIILSDFRNGKLNILMYGVMFFLFFWLLFVHYPFGVINPGSAIRYRSNFFHVFPIFIFYFWGLYRERGQVAFSKSP